MLSKVWDWTTARVLCTSLIFAAVIAFLYSARETLTLFLLAILFAYFVEPLVGRLERPCTAASRPSRWCMPLCSASWSVWAYSSDPGSSRKASRSREQFLPCFQNLVPVSLSRRLVIATAGPTQGRPNSRVFSLRNFEPFLSQGWKADCRRNGKSWPGAAGKVDSRRDYQRCKYYAGQLYPVPDHSF